MSHSEKSRRINSRENIFKSGVEDLNLSPEKEKRVKNLFQNYSDDILSSSEYLAKHEPEEFKQFHFFPGIVFILDVEKNILFQSRMFNDLRLSSGKTFGGCFNADNLQRIHAVFNEVKNNGVEKDVLLSDRWGKKYEVKISRYDRVRNLILMFLYPEKDFKTVEKTKDNLNLKVTAILEQVRPEIRFYKLKDGDFISLYRNQILDGLYNVPGNELFIESITELSSTLKIKMVEALQTGEMGMDLSESNLNNKASTRVILPITPTCVCLFSETVFNETKVDSPHELMEQYKLIANSLTDLFFILDNDLKFTFVAPSIESALGYQYRELVGKGFDYLVPKWSGNTLQKNLNSITNESSDISQPQKFIIQLSGKYGSLKWYEVQITGILDLENQLQGYNGVCRDITERLKYEETLMQAKFKAEESDKLKSAFLANMSHEIRTPLNGIIGFSTIISNKNLTTEKREKYANYIVSSSKQLLALIGDIIDISKIEAGQLRVFISKVNLHKLFSELLATIDVERLRLRKGNILLEYVNPDLPDLEIETDQVRLNQVLINLLSNALKFTETGSIIFGYQLKSNNKVRFFVKDTGEGISLRIQQLIFDRFRQGDINRQAKVSGTGLGLAISKGIIELLGGGIVLNSKENVGSEFHFTLPISK